jgi:multisubunit Na+/H+ antiporter MnhB subunit
VKYCACVWLVGIASISVVLFFFGAFDPALAICLSISAVLLFLLHFGRIPRDERTALADLVLLTPFAFLFLEKLL